MRDRSVRSLDDLAMDAINEAGRRGRRWRPVEERPVPVAAPPAPPCTCQPATPDCSFWKLLAAALGLAWLWGK